MDISGITKDYHELFSRCFIENCSIDQEEITEQEKSALNELDSTEVFENFTDLVTGLLKFKKQYVATDQADLVKRANSFESMIQKLENDVRNHIAIEHQLKLLLENYQGKIFELEKNNSELVKAVAERDSTIKEKSSLIAEHKPIPKSRSLERRSEIEEKFGVNTKEKIKTDIILVKNKDFKGPHKRTNSDFELFASQTHKKSAPSLKAAKCDCPLGKTTKICSQKRTKTGQKVEPGSRTDRKAKLLKPKHLRSNSDFLSQIKGK